MKPVQILLSSLLLATTITACAGGGADESESTEESDLASSRRRLACQLEYARYSPDFHTLHAGSFDEAVGTVRAQGASASDGRFALEARIHPEPPHNLSFIVNLRDLATGDNLAYGMLPPPRLGGDFLFELGGRIAPITLPGVATGEQRFDFLRSYCTLYLAE